MAALLRTLTPPPGGGSKAPLSFCGGLFCAVSQKKAVGELNASFLLSPPFSPVADSPCGSPALFSELVSSPPISSASGSPRGGGGDPVLDVRKAPLWDCVICSTVEDIFFWRNHAFFLPPSFRKSCAPTIVPLSMFVDPGQSQQYGWFEAVRPYAVYFWC